MGFLQEDQSKLHMQPHKGWLQEFLDLPSGATALPGTLAMPRSPVAGPMNPSPRLQGWRSSDIAPRSKRGHAGQVMALEGGMRESLDREDGVDDHNLVQAEKVANQGFDGTGGSRLPLLLLPGLQRPTSVASTSRQRAQVCRLSIPQPFRALTVPSKQEKLSDLKFGQPTAQLLSSNMPLIHGIRANVMFESKTCDH